MFAWSNRLIKEKSPYLLQHAHNPVNWYPWGVEAFDIAKELDRPIFLSIGYATCHWCHVMERESFCNETVAKTLNEAFVCIKIDREELPEVDALYMEFAQMLMSSGAGWPLNLILTPDLKPFYAMTYLPPMNSRGMMGLNEVSLYIKELWEGEDRVRILSQAREILEVFQETLTETQEKEEFPAQRCILFGVEALLSEADVIYGGRKGSPKFPLSYQIEFLIEYAHLYKDPRPLSYSELTLEMMQRGGGYDHLGGGFSRYCVDDKWLIPHFEKMLIDNASLARTYAEGFRFFKKKQFKEVAVEILDFLLKEMKGQEGCFYSAQDADSDGKEGVFYTWTPSELRVSLDEQESGLFSEFFNLSEEGNFEGRNVLYQSTSLEEFAERKKMDILTLKSKMDHIRKVLFIQRSKRKSPVKDDKILTSWNALAIDSFIYAGHLFKKPEYIEAGCKALESILQYLYKGPFLLHRFRDKEARFDGNLADYSYLIKALLTLFEYGHGVSYLIFAENLVKVLFEHFKAEEGGFYFSKEGVSNLLFRRCEFNDESEPSSNSVLVENFIRLYQITKDPIYKRHVEGIFMTVGALAAKYPQGYIYCLKALMRFYNSDALTIVIALDETESLKEEYLQWVLQCLKLHLVSVWKKNNEEIVPCLRDKNSIDGQTAFYVCTQKQCFPPVLNIEDLEKIISSL